MPSYLYQLQTITLYPVSVSMLITGIVAVFFLSVVLCTSTNVSTSSSIVFTCFVCPETAYTYVEFLCGQTRLTTGHCYHTMHCSSLNNPQHDLPILLG